MDSDGETVGRAGQAYHALLVIAGARSAGTVMQKWMLCCLNYSFTCFLVQIVWFAELVSAHSPNFADVVALSVLLSCSTSMPGIHGVIGRASKLPNGIAQ